MSTDISMIERAARAAYEKRKEHDAIPFVPTWKNLDPRIKAKFLAEQRAAIEAMREPTKGMLKAADAASYAIAGDGDAHADVWHWMIDAALSEQP